jgi:regulatory protein
MTRQTTWQKPTTKPFESTYEGARRYFAWLLSRREYAVSDLRSKAKQKGYLADHIDEAIGFMQQHGFQDDSRYAGMKARQSSSRWGNRRIAQALKSKQIAEDVVQQQLEELPEEDERAWQVIERLSNEPWSPELRQKAWRRLASRGFSSSSIKTVLSRLMTESLVNPQ